MEFGQNLEGVNKGFLVQSHFGPMVQRLNAPNLSFLIGNPTFKQGQTQHDANGRATIAEYLSLNADASAGKRAISDGTLVANPASATVLQPRLTPDKQHPIAFALVIGRACDSRK